MGYEFKMILYMALRDYYDISYHIPSISINFTTSPAEISLFSIMNPPNDFTKIYRMKHVPKTPPFVDGVVFVCEHRNRKPWIFPRNLGPFLY